MDNATVTYTGKGFPASVTGYGVGVDWTAEIEKGLDKVRAKLHTVRGDYVIIQSTRSGGLFCVPTTLWLKCGGTVEA